MLHTHRTDLEKVYRRELLSRKKNIREYLLILTKNRDIPTYAQPFCHFTYWLKMSIPLPALEIQDRILSVIAPIDEKIKENTKINDNLTALIS